MFQLQERQMIGKPAIADAPRGDPPLDRLRRHEQQALQVEGKFLPDAQRAVRAEIAVTPVQQQNAAMIGRAVKDVLAHIAPAGRGQGGVHIGIGQRLAHPLHAHFHQARMAVAAAAFIGHPIGPHIPFFEDMNDHVQFAGDFDRLRVDRPRVAIKHQIGHAFIGHQCAEAVRPFLGRAGIGDIAAPFGPEGAVARVEPHAPDLGTGAPDHPAQSAEEGPVRPLQKEKDAPVARDHCFATCTAAFCSHSYRMSWAKLRPCRGWHLACGGTGRYCGG